VVGKTAHTKKKTVPQTLQKEMDSEETDSDDVSEESSSEEQSDEESHENRTIKVRITKGKGGQKMGELVKTVDHGKAGKGVKRKAVTTKAKRSVSKIVKPKVGARGTVSMTKLKKVDKKSKKAGKKFKEVVKRKTTVTK
jgi:hypothetical protein